MTPYFDHLLTFPDEATAIGALGRFRGPVGETGAIGWTALAERGDLILGVRLVRADAVYDEAGDVVTPADIAPGWTIGIALPAADLSLTQIGAPYIIADREAAGRGVPFVIATSYAPKQIAGIVAVEPTWAGSSYPFGGA